MRVKLAFVVSTLLSAGHAIAAPVVQTFDVQNALGTYLSAINDAGTSAGFFQDQADYVHGVIRAPDGTYTVVDVPGALTTYINSIDQAGDVAGVFVARIGRRYVGQCFIRSADGSFTIVGPTEGRQRKCSDATINNVSGFAAVTSDLKKSEGITFNSSGQLVQFLKTAIENVAGINDAGVIAGDVSDPTLYRKGFVRNSNGRVQTFDASGGRGQTVVTGINPSGATVGSFSGSAISGFIRTADGTLTTFDAKPTKKSQYTSPQAINSNGDVAGYYDISDKPTNGFIRTSNGAVTTISFSGAVSAGAFALNDQDVVVGYYADQQGEHGFIWTP